MKFVYLNKYFFVFRHWHILFNFQPYIISSFIPKFIEEMSKKPEQSDLGISLRDMASILETGKKLTRGAKNQLKNNASEKEIAEKQSEVSLDSKRSIETRKDAKKGEKIGKKKEASTKSMRVVLSEFLGVPAFEAYVNSDTLQPKTSFSLQKTRISEVSKNHLPSIIRVLLKHNYTKELFEVRKGELKKQKTTRQQFLVDFQVQSQTTGAMRSDVRSITKDNGIVMIGQNVCMMRLGFEDWRQLFKEEIEEVKREVNSRGWEKEQQDQEKREIISEEKMIEKKQGPKGYQQAIDEKNASQEVISQLIPQRTHFLSTQAKTNAIPQPNQPIFIEQSVQFVRITKNSNDFLNLSESSEHPIDPQNQNQVPIEEQSSQMKKKDSEKFQDSSMQIQDQKKGSSKENNDNINFIKNDEDLFARFCIPGNDYILWPAVIYDTAIGSNEEVIEIIDKQEYFFSEKQRSCLFQTIGKRHGGLFNRPLQPRINQTHSQSNLNYSSSLQNLEQIEYQAMLNNFTSNIKPRISQKQQIPLQLQTQQKQQISSQLNLILHPFGSNKLTYIKSSEISQKLLPWNLFDQKFLTYYLFKSSFSSIVEEVCQAIQRLNEFCKVQVAQCRPEDVRLALERVVKCNIQGNIYNAITLRYSHVQKKMLTVVFNKKDELDQTKMSTHNELCWLNLDQVFPNYTVSHINTRGKFFLYFSNSFSPQYPISLSQYLTDLYSNFFYRDFDNLIHKSPYTYVLNLRAIQPPSSQTSLQLSSIPQRCLQCYYPIYRMQHFQCFFCHSYCHKQCSTKVINKSIQANFESHNNLWTCNSCQPCTICLQPLENKSICCVKCKNMFHEVCGKLKLQDNTIHREKYLCENCIQCNICEKKLKNLDYVLIKGGYQCVNCHKAEQANQICHICKKQGNGGKWAQCSRQFCGKWIHRDCDKYLQSRSNFFSNNNEEQYFCPFCRRVERRKIIVKFIQILTIFDQYQYFIGSDYQDILDYKYIILNPMCFRKMYERCLEGAYDESPKESLLRDFELIISNAVKYNMPKDQPHYQARILNILGHHAVEKFSQELECSQQEIIYGGVHQRMPIKRRQLHAEIYDRYLELILNYRSKNSIVEVKRPKQSLKGQKLLSVHNGQQQSFIFSSRHLLKDVFRSAMLKFKITKKSSTIQNLFQIQKVIEAFKYPIKQNFCYHHYWNSNIIFYCEICMEHYCCTTKCYKHNICAVCGTKGCGCDASECDCPPLKEKDKKMYEKLMVERYYDRREITENFKLCLRCAFEKLNNRVCVYCEKSYEFFYDFEQCKSCHKIYHKECADSHASSFLSKFFFKQPKTPNFELFSNTLRLSQTCYECSISRPNKFLMFQKLKAESLQKLLKLQKLVKYQLLIATIYQQNGIKLSLNDILNVILNNYDEFLSYEQLFEEYRMNLPSIRFNTRLYKRVEERIQTKVKNSLRLENDDGQEETEEERKMDDCGKAKHMQSKCGKYQFQSASVLNLYLAKVGVNIKNVQIDLNSIWSQGLTQQRKQFSSKYAQIPLLSDSYLKKLRFQNILQQFQQTKFKSKCKKMILENSRDFSTVSIQTSPGSKKVIGSSKQLASGASSNTRNAAQNQSQQVKSSKGIPDDQTKSPLDKQPKLLNFILIQPITTKSFTQIQLQTIESKFLDKNSLGYMQHRGSLLAFKSCTEGQNLFRGKRHNPIVYDLDKEQMDVEDSFDGNIEMMEFQKIDVRPQQLRQLEQQAKDKDLQVQGRLQKGLHQQSAQMDSDMALEQAVEDMYTKQPQTQPQLSFTNSIQFDLMKMHCSQTNTSRLSKFKHLTTIHQIISRFLLRCFEFNKSFYRRGNTCVLKSDNNCWRVLKKGKNNNEIYDITLKKEAGKWFLSINENTWWVDTLEQIISKLKPLVSLGSFRELADFLGFTFKFIPIEKAAHFTKLLQRNPLDEKTIKEKKQMIVELYDNFEWHKNGTCKNKANEQSRQEIKQFTVTKKPIYYLKKRKSVAQEQQKQPTSSPPYITFQDLKKDLQDISIISQKQKNQKIQFYIQQQIQQRVFIGPSPIHKLGLFAKQNYPKFTIMVEYVGQIVSQAMADVRQSKFHFGCYMFGLNRRNADKRQIIDATFRGNMARYLNHCCDPNCKARIEVVNNHPRIFIYSIRDIEQYEQLTYDYQFSVDANEKLVCTCGAKNCQGRLN